MRAWTFGCLCAIALSVPLGVLAQDEDDCQSDDDCGEGEVCVENESEECSGSAGGPACDPEDETCPDVDPAPSDEECTVVTYTECVPSWQMPCEAAADCGAGFECVESEVCTCPGGDATPGSAGTAGASASSGDSAGSAGSQGGGEGGGGDDCTCEPLDEKECELIGTECTSDDDCDEGLVCDDNPAAGDVGDSVSDGGAPAPGGSGAPPPVDTMAGAGGAEGGGEGGGGGEDEPEKVCQPEGYADDFGVPGGAASGDPMSTGGSNDADGPDDSEGASGSGGSGDSSSDDDDDDDGGCSAVGAPSAGAVAPWLLVLTLLAARRRRR